MALTETNKRKAAALLMSLDATTASELLEGLPPDEIQQLAVEMAQIETLSHRDKKDEAKIVLEFCNSLQKSQSRGLNIKSFLNETLVNILDKEKVEEIQSQVRKAMEKKDPFEPIHSAKTDELVLALEDESPATIALILPELEPKKAQEILPLLDREICCKVVWNMTKPAQLGSRVKQRIASVISKRLKSFEGETVVTEKPKETLRNLDIMLSDTERDLRDKVLDEIEKHDEETATMVKNLMITWEDIPSIADRSLQEALRTMESSKLAVALYQADEEIAQKIRSNISERVAAAVEEETMLMQEPLEKEILDAREQAVEPLRKANEEGTLRRVKG